MKKLVDMVKTDANIENRFKACKNHVEQSMLANELGLAIPAEEFEKLNKLSDEQLDQVAGGGCFINIVTG
jgi:predicted ribosomally synthesized peptide with nif11-like leader